MTMNTRIKSIAIAAGLVTAVVGWTAPAFAQEPASTLQGVLDRIRQDIREQSEESRQREAAFQQERNQQARLLQEAEDELASLEDQADRLQELMDQNDTRILELQEELRAGQGDFGELFGVARQSSLDIIGALSSSYIAAQPGMFDLDTGDSMIDRLETLSEAEQLPSRDELDAIWKTLITEMVRQREVVTFDARVGNIGRGGTTETAPVTRVGPFTLFAMDGGSARFVTVDDGDITVLAKPAASRLRSAAAAVARGAPDRLYSGPLDPSSGTLLSIIVDAPSLGERYQQGGIAGYTISVLFVIAVVFGLLRLVQLLLTSAAVRGQARSGRASKGNPLGRVLLAAEDARSADIETFELKLDDAIIRESSGLDFGLNFLKLAAAIAPMLGLLGTVIGMIITFQQITLFGAGDPQRMADGISTALVTTVLGLIAAIPIMLIHSFCASGSRSVQQVLEEQAAGIVARHAEARRT